jgi:hypothetical protein
MTGFGKGLGTITTVLLLVAMSAGCGGSAPPCETDLTAVDSARQVAQAAEEKVAAAEREKQQLEAALAAEQARKAELERRQAELEAKLSELSK